VYLSYFTKIVVSKEEDEQSTLQYLREIEENSLPRKKTE